MIKLYSSMMASTSLPTTIHSTEAARSTIWAVRGGMHRVLEVVRDAASKRHRLTDVDDPAGRVPELVRAGGVGNRLRAFEH